MRQYSNKKANDTIIYMNEYRNTDKDIHRRIYRFVVGCFKDVVRKIPKIVENHRIIDQLTGSLTSIGANDHEADAAFTRKDFIAKYMIVRKEAKETLYWFSFVKDTAIVQSAIVEPYIKECQEIFYIVSSIVNHSLR